MRLMLCGVLLMWMSGQLRAQEGLDFKAAPPVPMMSVSPSPKPPTIDGKIDPGEWDDAAAVSTLQQWGQALADPPTVAYVTYDAERIYFAYAAAKDKPGWYGARNRFRDSPVYLDPSFELFLSPDNSDGKTTIYQWCFNAYGAIFDQRVRPEIGLTEPGYNPKVTLKSVQSADRWVVEGSIAIGDLHPGGFKDGQSWRANFVRSWPQRAWSLRGGPYIARDAMGEMRLDNAAPAVQWLNVSSLNEGRLDLELAIKNKTDQAQKYEITARVTGETGEQELDTFAETRELKPGERQTLRLVGKTDFAGKRGHADLLIRSGEKVWYSQVVRFDKKHAGATTRAAEAFKTTVEMPKDMAVSVRYGPMSNALEVQADIWSLTRAGVTPAAVELTIVADGSDASALPTKRLTHFQNDLALTRLDLPKDMSAGKYVVRATAMDSAGQKLSSAEAKFERKDIFSDTINRPRQARPGKVLDWMNSQAGVSEAVLPPWTPIRAKGAAAALYGRAIQLDPLGLPMQITSQQTDLLAGPVTLAASVDGKPVKPTPTTKPAFHPNVHASEAEWTGGANLGPGVAMQIDGAIEFDGLMKFAVQITGEQRGKLDSLVLDIPLRKELADRLLLPTGLGHVPAGDGQIWESKTVRDDQIMGTLVPYVWIGTTQVGLTWAADHTRGWVEKVGESVVTIHRQPSGVVSLRVHLVQEAGGTFDQPMQFFLLPTPTKPRPIGWRNYAVADDWNYFWFTGWFGIQQKVKGKQNVQISWDDTPADAMKAGNEQARQNNQTRLALPYNNPGFTVPHPMPWVVDDVSPTSNLMKEEWANIPSRWGPVKPVASYRDWAADTMQYWIQQQGYFGYYVDEAYGGDGPDCNLLNGSGWFDRHGNLRGSYHAIDTRELMKRMYTLTRDNCPRPFMLIHTSSFGMAPLWSSFATATCSGEGDWEVHVPGESLLDRLPESTLQLSAGQAFGFFATFFGDKMKGDPELIAQSRRQIEAELMLYDMVPNARENNPQAAAVRKIKTDFGFGEPDVRFTGYWERPEREEKSKVLVSRFERGRRALLVLVNADRTNAQTIELNAWDKRNAVPNPIKPNLTDAETGKPVDSKIELPPRGVQWIYAVESSRN